jgi:hypothetical protein
MIPRRGHRISEMLPYMSARRMRASQLVGARRHWPASPLNTRALESLPAGRIGALAVGAIAVGALAIGALAVGALAVGRMSVRKARFREVEIDRLTVRQLRVLEPGRPRYPAMPPRPTSIRH